MVIESLFACDERTLATTMGFQVRIVLRHNEFRAFDWGA